MSIFQFKYFSVRQQTAAMKVGTDAMLLGAFATVRDSNTVLDIGAGTGVLSLMLAQKAENLHITAIECDKEALLDLNYNLNKTPFNSVFTVVSADFSKVELFQKFDVIISNPPYFKNSYTSQNTDKRSVARNEENLSFELLIYKAAKLLVESGLFWFIVPTTAEIEIEGLLQQNHLAITQKIMLFGKEKQAPVRIIYSVSPQKNLPKEQSNFTIRNADNTYTDAYVALTKEFHAKDVSGSC